MIKYEKRERKRKNSPSSPKQISIKTLDSLESRADELAKRLAQESKKGGDQPSGDQAPDLRTMSGELTKIKTDIVRTRTAAEKLRGNVEVCLGERKRRGAELKKFQGVVLDLEHWLLSTQGQLGAEVKMSNIKAVRDNLQVTEVLTPFITLLVDHFRTYRLSSCPIS